MMEFSDFEGHGENVMDCAASLYGVTDQIREKLSGGDGEMDFDHRGIIATLRMLVERLEKIASEITKSVEFHESPAGEEIRKRLASVAAVNK